LSEKIIVTKEKYELPFSRGILAQSLTRAGLDQLMAYDIAEDIKKELIMQNIFKVRCNDLRNIILEKLEKIDKKIAEQYTFLEVTGKGDKPTIILISGSSGTGTSTVAANVAQRMGIRNVIGTDIIREVLRKIISSELAPTLHKSSFNAWEVLRTPLPTYYSRVLFGFREQVEYVVVGIEAVIDRALKEGVSIVIEGIHIVPGFIKMSYLQEKNIFMFMLKLKDTELHRSRYYVREEETQKRRPAEHYLKHFYEIREIHDFLVEEASKYNILCIDNIYVEQTTDIIIERVISETIDKVKKPID